MGIRRLTRDDRYQIQALYASRVSIRQIGRQLGRPPSTVCREINRGKGPDKFYSADLADKRSYDLRHASHLGVRRIQAEVEVYVQEKLKADWSPEQVAGRMEFEGAGSSVSYLTIYRYVERDKRQGGDLWKHLRILRKQRKDRKNPYWKPHAYLPSRIPIKDRPEIVEQRNRLGDYERDTVLGKRGGSVLLTIVDRTSRLLKLAWLEKSDCYAVHRATVSLLKKEPLHTITNDNGFEFMRHRDTSKALGGVGIYFSRAYRSWERGTNENTNGLLRQYFPKKKDIGIVSSRHVSKIANLLNSRPRKCLGFKTPNEIHAELQNETVALIL